MSEYPGIDYLMAMPQYGRGGDVAIRPGLKRIKALLDRMDHPERGYPCIHVGGTNGKGSAASFTAAVLTAHGLRVGLHTSPHLVSPTERMRVDGRPAPARWLSDTILDLRKDIDETGASYFETAVAVSFAWFASQKVDVAVVEVGLGGRLDATNVLSPRVSVITRIALDHTHLLGETIGAIAREKAGIVKAGAPVVATGQEPSAEKVLRQAAARVQTSFSSVSDASWSGGTLTTSRGRYTRLFPGLEGGHQRGNAAAAVLAAEAFLDAALDSRSTRRGLRHVRTLAGIRCRYERWSEEPLVVLDVAHNPAAVLPVLRRFSAEEPERRQVLMGLMADKDVESILAEIARLDVSVIPYWLDAPRALAASQLEKRLRALEVTTREPVGRSGLSGLVGGLRGQDALLVVGSHQLAGAFLEELEGRGHS